MDILTKLPSPLSFTKQEIVDMLLREEYGYLPSAPTSVTATEESCDSRFCAGKADFRRLTLHCSAEWGDFSFPVSYICPSGSEKPVPCFVHINFFGEIPNKYQPTEEIIDSGYAILTFCHEDVTSDDEDMTNGLSGIVYPQGKRQPHQCGKIGLWTWAAMAVMDYVSTLPELDKQRISVIGHSRLGKTALLTGALDERFYCAISNDSGCSGAALSRDKSGETIDVITDKEKFHYWFCEHYRSYAFNEDALPFDQHWLLAANAPHKVYVASAVMDTWACPKNEFLSCVAASEYYEKLGLPGFVHHGKLPEVGELFHDGCIAYHMRAGRHYLSREDWQYYIRYLNA